MSGGGSRGHEDESSGMSGGGSRGHEDESSGMSGGGHHRPCSAVAAANREAAMVTAVSMGA